MVCFQQRFDFVMQWHISMCKFDYASDKIIFMTTINFKLMFNRFTLAKQTRLFTLKLAGCFVCNCNNRIKIFVGWTMSVHLIYGH